MELVRVRLGVVRRGGGRPRLRGRVCGASQPGGRHLPHEGPDLLEVTVVRGESRCPTGSLPDTCALRLVLPQVAVQVCLLPETPLAQRAFEGLFLIVNVPDVALEVTGYGKGSLAVFAAVGLLARVGAQVPRQVGAPGKHLAAELARVPVAGPAGGLRHRGRRGRRRGAHRAEGVSRREGRVQRHG